MGKLSPINDYFLVEEIKQQWSGGMTAEDGVRKGRVIAISDFLTYWGSHTYYFESSANNDEMLKQVQEKYKALVGKIVYWPAMSESGTVVEHDGKTYIFMKWASCMGVEEDD